MTDAPPADEARLLAFLDEIGVAWRLTRHAPFFTVEESKALRDDLPGAHTKNLFLKERKGGFWLATCLEDRRIRISQLAAAAGAKRLSFATAEDLRAVLGVAPGAVTPFAALNDRPATVRVILDAQMAAMDPQHFHPLHNAATLAVGRAALPRFFAATGHQVALVDFDALEAAAAEKTA